MKPKQPARKFLALGAGNGTGYTRQPLRECPQVADEPERVEQIAACTDIRDEPEALSGAWLQDWAEVAQLHKSQQHAKDVAAAKVLRPMLAAEDRLKDIHRRAKHSHVDLSHELSIMRRELDRARTGGRQPLPRTLDRMERLEGGLDAIAA